MAGKPHGGRKRALTATERQKRWRAKVRRRQVLAGHRDPASLRTRKARPEDNEFWPTPPCLRAALVARVLEGLPEDAVIWECGAGNGALGDAIAATGRRVIMTDIDPQRRDIRRHDVFDPPPSDTVGTIAVTNLPWSEERLDPFLARLLFLLDSGHLRGVVLLLRIDHTGAARRADIMNRAVAKLTCCWRPRWIPGTKGNGRWWCVWVTWLASESGPPVDRSIDLAELRAAGYNLTDLTPTPI
jgi:hypothetical protein